MQQKTKFFLRSTNNTDRNGVHKQNTYTEHLEKDIIGKGGGATMSQDVFECMLFGSAREARMTSTLFELKIYQETRTSCFFEKILYANELKVKKVSLNVPDLLKIVLSRA